jgi:uncharacterized membrane protein
MKTIADVVLVAHIVAGFVALFAAPVAMMTLKGAQWHRRAGKVYFWAMAAVAASALALVFFRPNPFLLLVAVFSFYLAFTGYRALYRKHGERGTALDWLASGLTFHSGLGLIALGIWQPAPMFAGAPIASVVFGGLAAAGSLRDMWGYAHRPADPRAWFYAHIAGMLGAYIATLTAFSAVNFSFLPPVVRWLWPTVIGIPAISLWTAYYKRKYATRRVAALEGTDAAAA